ncbi:MULTISPECIES: DUF6894 family protein [Caulobacter]|jgi:hypothetical protein|uniref:DUF6894 family protein n=1 Tax=Caulobacter TaxID=75 RepID=UPI0006FC0427|nr:MULTISPECIES: hypothetical protein [Caulobacter]KQZ17517.1 hypothetical protein ASD47_12290 [Caulobacter sp. Root1472]GGL08032.1 hypothetical protein GCM10010983_01480 [Caulobacter rhizosphaerae]
MRYFFKLTDGEIYDDNQGVDISDTAAAEREAALIAAEWLRDNPDTFLRDGILKVEILDEQKDLVATIDIAIVRPGAASPA